MNAEESTDNIITKLQALICNAKTELNGIQLEICKWDRRRGEATSRIEALKDALDLIKPPPPLEKALTYSSTQSTNCARCGERKHTPIRNDEMGGYVCLTCIDKELLRLQSKVK